MSNDDPVRIEFIFGVERLANGLAFLKAEAFLPPGTVVKTLPHPILIGIEGVHRPITVAEIQATLSRFQEHGESEKRKSEIQKVVALAGGRKVIVRYKPGGRIRELHEYDSDRAVSDSKHFQAFFGSIWMTSGEGGQLGPIDHRIIGRGFIGVAPWDDPLEKLSRPLTETEKLEMGSPFRVSDVIETPDSVTVEFESV